ncbi:MAG: DNA polymerase III subunit delta' [Humidesulfovibrio sp.]|jgi:DNA polymerase-3 subunit delta'|uniref:DNA polymerase III subunit delta' n=1 Tax=Humidesulfovibrio sp. TaxID=2910988 RepID=UPI002736F79B|nr:DNA polymerase III subunit delta' [Humidesulfovibrio sp.]MDP2846626.1 DNA polymerase III subunit delta' [Humidesulfovibrio sp.]
MQKTAASQPAPAPAQPSTPVDGQVLARMRTLAQHPPQSLVMEGGSAAEREAAALGWAKVVNCPQGGCGVCGLCRQIEERAYRDLIVVDKAFFDEAKQGGVSGTDAVRRLLPVWGQPAHGAGKRVTVFLEAQDLHPSVANLLLKTLEEPRPGNVFVLLAPQRERLLQTLVSRSFVLTLPWPEAKAPEADAAEWIAALLNFWDSGQGWFERTGTKGAADRSLALRILSGLSRELAHALAGQDSPVARRLARLGPLGLRRLDLVLAQAQEALTQPTAPVALVLDWMATAVIPKESKPAPRSASAPLRG